MGVFEAEHITLYAISALINASFSIVTGCVYLLFALTVPDIFIPTLV